MRIGDNTSSDSDNTITPNKNTTTLANAVEIMDLADSLLSIFGIRLSLLDLNNEIQYTSNNSEKIIGYTIEDFKLLDTFGYIHPDDRNKVKRKFLSIKKNTDYTDTIDYRIFRPNGELRWIRGFSFKFLDPESGKKLGLFIIENDVTDQINKNEIELQDDQFFKVIIELNNHPILFTRNHQIVWTSQNWLNFFDYSMDQIVNKPIEFLFTDQDEYAEFLFESNKSLKKNGFIDFEATLQDRKKKHYKVKVSARAVDKSNLSKGIVMVFRDVSDIEIKPETGDKFILSILENYESIVIQVINGKISWVNNYLANELQYETEELLNQDLSILFQTKEMYKTLINEINKSFLVGRNYNGEITCLRKDRMPIQFSINAIQSYSENAGFIIILKPIGDLRSLVNLLRKEKNELEFYSDLLFHDVRNLCQDALSQLELSLLRMKNDQIESANRQNKSISEIQRISELITNMDIFFRIKRQEYELKAIDIFRFLEFSIEKIKHKFEQRNVKIKTNMKSKTYFILGNEWLENAFFNVLDNAVKYDKNNDAEVEITINSSFEKEGYWYIEIIDNGPGIGEELKENLFDRYARGKGTIHGSGFGLTLVKAIIESFNGNLSVQDRDPKNRNKGSKIIIELPKEDVQL
ncbi:MAG: PAS domain-containing protein [Candidatus Heimdallarchaeota archaeon]|nr:PAS domain-containing protein [Candidatus Heimdallarchaeota archaeon]